MAHIAVYRVLALVVFALVLGPRVGERLAIPPFLAAASAGGALALAATCRCLPLRHSFLLRACVWPAGAWALLAAAMFEAGSHEPLTPESLRAAGTVTEQAAGTVTEAGKAAAQLWVGEIAGIPVPEPEGSRVILQLAGIVAAGVRARDGSPAVVPVTGRVAARIPGGAPAPGEWWLLRGPVSFEPGRRNPGGPDRAAWAARRGVGGRIAVAHPSAVRRLCPRPASYWRPDLAAAAMFADWRRSAHAALAARFAPEAAGLAEAMSIGMRGSLAPDTIAGFRHLGWQHLIAVSGMNVGFVLGVALAVLHFARLPQRLVTAALLLVLFLYTPLSGGEPPVVRATVMALLCLLARACDRTLSTGRALAVAALICLSFDPSWIADPSFQLSFGALAGIALLGPRLDWAHPLASLAGQGTRGSGLWGRVLLIPLWSGLAAQVGCLPVLAASFHGVSPWGALTGPLAIPHSALLVAAVLLGLVIRPFVPPLGDLCLGGAAVITEALLAVERLGAGHLPPPWPMAFPGATVIVILVAALAVVAVAGLPLFARRGTWQSGGVLAAVLTSAVMVLGWPASRGPTARVDVIFLDVGQGDAAVALAYGARGWLECLGCRRRPQATLILDVGDHPPEGFDAGRAVVAPALASLGVRTVDAVILSHGDRDHVGGLAGLARTLPVREIVWPRPLAPSRDVERLTSGGGRPGVQSRPRLRLAARGDTLYARAGLVAVALHPPVAGAPSGNDGSLVVRLSAFGRHVLFTGDVEALGESILCENAKELGVEVVKVPHHGSRTSSTAAFVAAASARHAVVSVGAENRFGHPAPEVLERWRSLGSRLWRTDSCGAVTVVLEAKGVSVSGMVPE